MKRHERRPLTIAEERFVALVLGGTHQNEAADAVGVPRTRIAWLKRHPRYLELFEASKKEIHAQVSYALEDAIREVNEAIAFAQKVNSATAYVNALKLKAELMGHLGKDQGSNNAAFQINISGVESKPLAPKISILD